MNEQQAKQIIEIQDRLCEKAVPSWKDAGIDWQKTLFLEIADAIKLTSWKSLLNPQGVIEQNNTELKPILVSIFQNLLSALMEQHYLAGGMESADVHELVAKEVLCAAYPRLKLVDKFESFDLSDLMGDVCQEKYDQGLRALFSVCWSIDCSPDDIYLDFTSKIPCELITAAEANKN